MTAHLPQEEVLQALCTYDPRSPFYADLLYCLEEHMPKPRQSCACDQCFHGTDKLAVEILRLQNLAQ